MSCVPAGLLGSSASASSVLQATDLRCWAVVAPVEESFIGGLGAETTGSTPPPNPWGPAAAAARNSKPSTPAARAAEERPEASWMPGSAPCCSRSLAASWFDSSSATCNGVIPVAARALASAPQSSSIRTICGGNQSPSRQANHAAVLHGLLTCLGAGTIVPDAAGPVQQGHLVVEAAVRAGTSGHHVPDLETEEMSLSRRRGGSTLHSIEKRTLATSPWTTAPSTRSSTRMEAVIFDGLEAQLSTDT